MTLCWLVLATVFIEDRSPKWWFAILAFIWGSGPGLFFALTLNHLALAKTDILTAITVAGPIFEEISKGIILLFFAWHFALHKDRLLFLALTFVVGITFAGYENIMYLYNAVDSVGVVHSSGTFVSRSIANSTLHTFFMFPLAFCLIYEKPAWKGFFLGILLHILWNTLAIMGQVMHYWMCYWALFLPTIIGVYLYMIYLYKKERKFLS